jgi:hypothetical protein
MSERQKQDPRKATPEKAEQKSGKESIPLTPNTSGRAKRGSDFRDADLLDAPVEDPEDQIPD